MSSSGLLGRIVIGTVLALAAFTVAVFAPSWTVTLLVAAWSVLATLEFARLLRQTGINLSPWLLGLLNASTAVAAWLGWLPAYVITPVAVVFVYSVLSRSSDLRSPAYSTLAVVYLGLMPAHLVLLRQLAAERTLSTWLAAFPLVATWICDTAAWAFGRLLGRHKLAPAISPEKTVEGFVAGLFASAALAVFFLPRFAPFTQRPWFVPAVIGLVLGGLAQAGDLFESMFKRAASVKDSSRSLGAHGGFLDRVDSLLFTVPAWYYLLLLYLR